MFKIGDKVVYIGNNYPHLRGQEHVIDGIVNFLQDQNLKLNSETSYYPSTEFALVTNKSAVDYSPPKLFAGDRVRVTSVEGLFRASCVDKIGLIYECQQSKKYPDSLYIRIDSSLTFYVNGEGYKNFRGIRVEFVEVAQPRVEEVNKSTSEGDRLMAFFKASAHDGNSS